MRLAVITHKHVYRYEGGFFTIGGFSRQMMVLRCLFDEVIICAPVRNMPVPPGGENLIAQGLVIAPLPYVPTNTILQKLRFLIMVPVLICKIRSSVRGADIVQVRIPNYIGILGAIVMRLVHKPTFVWLGGDWSGSILSRGNSFLRQITSGFFHWFLPRLLHDWLVFVPEPSVLGRNISKVKAIRVVNASVWKDELPDVRRSRLPLNSNELFLLFVGRLDPIKGADVLIRALARIQEHSWHLNIVGDGAQRQDLISLARQLKLVNRISFHGWVARKELDAYYREADVVVVPSLNEMSPKVVLEAMSYGIIVVASAVGALPEILAEGRGILVEPSDEERLAVALKSICQEPERYSDICLAAQTYAEENTLESLGTKMGAVLRETFGFSELRAT